MPIISYKGQTMNSCETEQLTQEQFEKLREQYYAKPSERELEKEITNLVNGGVKMTVVENYYFKDLMAQTKVYFNKWTIADCFEYKPLLDRFYSKTLRNDKVFTSDDLLANIETAFRLGGKGVASKVANFPLSTLDQIFKRYNVNNNYYDMSCGWGARLTASLKNNINYFGTDPNYELVDRLKSYVEKWKKTTWQKKNVDIRAIGSETFIQEWENKMGLCFTSPPYFGLEDYKIGNQSYKDGMEYKEWLDNFMAPTIRNCHKYLIDNGYLAINIKDYAKYTLEKDTKEICEKNGFVYIENFELDNISRVNSIGEFVDANENIMVFMKKGFEHLHKPYSEPTQLSMFDL